MRIAIAAVLLFVASIAAAMEQGGFEENRGQYPPSVLFRARTADLDVYVHPADLRIALPVRVRDEHAYDFVQLAFVGANAVPLIQKADALAGTTTYVRAASTISDVRAFDHVALEELYNHVGLDLTTWQGRSSLISWSILAVILRLSG